MREGRRAKYARRQRMIELGLDRTRRGGDSIERYTGLDAESVQHEQQVFGGEIARGARRERAAAESARRAVERRDAVVESRKHICESGAARVVEVQRDLREWHERDRTIEHRPHLSRMRGANRVADRNLVNTDVELAPGNVGDLGGLDWSFERTD